MCSRQGRSSVRVDKNGVDRAAGQALIWRVCRNPYTMTIALALCNIWSMRAARWCRLDPIDIWDWPQTPPTSTIGFARRLTSSCAHSVQSLQTTCLNRASKSVDWGSLAADNTFGISHSRHSPASSPTWALALVGAGREALPQLVSLQVGKTLHRPPGIAASTPRHPRILCPHDLPSAPSLQPRKRTQGLYMCRSSTALVGRPSLR